MFFGTDLHDHALYGVGPHCCGAGEGGQEVHQRVHLGMAMPLMTLLPGKTMHMSAARHVAVDHHS